MTDPIAVSITASMIAAKIECASYLADDHPTVQAFARFEADERKDERERCARVAESELVETFEDSPEIDTVCNAVVREIAAAIRNLGEG